MIQELQKTLPRRQFMYGANVDAVDTFSQEEADSH